MSRIEDQLFTIETALNSFRGRLQTTGYWPSGKLWGDIEDAEEALKELKKEHLIKVE